MGNKDIFAKNLNKYMKINGKSRREVCHDLGFSYYTFSDWCNGKKYPRMDKVEMLANYFGILKSDLIEEKLTPETEKDNDLLVKIIVRLRSDQSFRKTVEALYPYDETKLNGVHEMLQAFSQ